MSDETIITDTTDTPETPLAAIDALPVEVADAAPTVVPTAAPAGDRRTPRGGARGGKGGGGRGGRTPSRQPRVRSEFDQKMINVRRVARVVSGGRRFSFSVAIIIGNRKGKVGVGLGKAGDTTLAIDKATRNAKKNMITVHLTKDSSVSHDVNAKYCASLVSIMPAPGRSLVAGSSVRSVLELAGITNTVAKLHSGSKNGLNNARATIEALRKLKV